MTKRFWYASAGIAALLTTTAAQAGTLWIANMNNANEPGTVARNAATGTTSLILNDAQTSATIRGTHNEALVNPSPVTLGHIHRGPAGAAGPVIFPYPNPNSPFGPLVWAIPASDVVNLQNGGLYSNIHTQQNPGGDIRGQFLRALLAPSATTASQATVARALDVSAGYDTDLDLALIATNTGTAKAQALDDISGASLYVQHQEALGAMGDFLNAATSQGEKHHRLWTGDEAGFSVFAQAGGSFGTRKTVDGETGAKISRPSIVGGLNYAFDGMNVGLAVSYAEGRNTLNNSYGKTTGKTVAVEGYVSTDFNGSPITMDAAVGFGKTSYDMTRALPSFGRTATASTDGTVWGGMIKVAAPLKTGSGFSVSPYAQLDTTAASVDAYTESGAGSLGLIVSDRNISNAYAELGVQVGASEVSAGGISPRLSVGWRHALDNGKGSVATRLIGSPVFFNTVFLPAKDGVALGAAIATRLSGGIELNLDYRGLVANPRLTAHAITAGLRVHF